MINYNRKTSILSICKCKPLVFLLADAIMTSSWSSPSGYFFSSQTINLLRAFSSGGFADINKLNAWNMDFVAETPEGSKYREMASKIEDTLRFMKVMHTY